MASGATIVAGYHEGTTSFGQITIAAPSQDAFVANYTHTGGFSWAVSAGGTGRDTAGTAMYNSLGNVIIAGRYSGSAIFKPLIVTNKSWADSAYVAAMDATGAFKWIWSADGPGVSGASFVAMDQTSALYAAGDFSESVSFGVHSIVSGGEIDIFVAKLRFAN